jgi:hypothetical protein
MDSRTKAKKRREFEALANELGQLPHSILASAHPLEDSPARRAAQRMIGGVPGDATRRVKALTRKLERLIAVDRRAGRRGSSGTG